MSATAIELPAVGGADSAPLKIDQKIVGWHVVTTMDKDGNTHTRQEVVPLERPRVVEGRTYKISPVVTDSAMYITINDIVLEDGTKRPFEMFISSKHVVHQQWITALTRMVSAIFRKPGPYLFVVEELEQIFDPQGGYFADQKMMPSVVAHVAAVLREHFIDIGALEAPQLSEEAQVVITEKKDTTKGKLQCTKCFQISVIVSEGCKVCTNCGESECG